MKFLITRDGLEQVVKDASGVIPSKTTLPILSNVRLEATGNHLVACGTDLDRSASVAVEADVEEEGAITVPAAKLRQLVSELEDAPVKVSTRGDRLEIACANASFLLNGLSVDEFPALPDVDFEGGWTLSGAELRSLIDGAAFAASTEDSRPILQGVLWELEGGTTAMAATNGHRLAVLRRALGGGEAPDARIIIPADALANVSRLFEDDDEITVARAQNHLGFRTDDKRVTTRLIEGPYPNYEQVIPDGPDKAAVVDRDAFAQVVRRMAVVASDQTHRIRIAFGGDEARFQVQTPDLGEATDELAIDYDGEPIEIAFNASYLSEVLKHMPEGDIRIDLAGSERAATIRPVDDDLDYLCLVMPLRLVD